ncbi:hypothetical protein [Gloeocapsa sp. PCC 73106]|uniref:hypothetical protein n=1 Tax=Gloeocapsa sp. PCC 73106 TaxID=102232 RepID=UPI0002ABE690|nr:hypothetical protein [Gloeocapsa sp. PCC 73106]ELR97415.1 hypothetical protein GLO73106DRAFT_00012250 [Gloeocapsa sp. PCC 73106]
MQIVINQAIKACVEKNARNFAALFAPKGEIILKKDYTIPRAEIETVTQTYFSTLEYIKIKIASLMIQGDRACLEWSWEDYNHETKRQNCHDNVILINFESELIRRWREYRG